MALVDEIEQRSREIKTDGYSMSIGEVISLYREGDLDVHPEFHAYFGGLRSRKPGSSNRSRSGYRSRPSLWLSATMGCGM
jgi:hypothetical protein